jgi:DNA topoisomerase-1
MKIFGEALPRIRARVDRDLSLPGLPCEKVLATIVRLLELTFIRIGNEEYARENRSYGLTTLRDKHVDVAGSTVRFKFKGKSGKFHNIDLNDRRLARIVKRCQDIPGYELFQYLEDDGSHRSVDSADVNEYLRSITDEQFTAKDFRTWAGTVLPAQCCASSSPSNHRPRRRRMSCRPLQTWPNTSEIRRLCAGSVTCTPPSSRPMSVERC